MPAFNFQPRFADLVESGAKTQTIRKTCRAKVGDTVYLYTGQRTKQCRKLGQGVVTSSTAIRLYLSPALGGLPMLKYGGRLLTNDGEENIATDDGFTCFLEMANWFQNQYGLPFEGWLITWRLNK